MTLVVATALFIALFSAAAGAAEPDPCKTGNHYELDQPERSTGYVSEKYFRCDRTLRKGWYRFISGAGWQMPETCPEMKRCGTEYPVWMKGTLPPRDGKVYDRKACTRIFGDCCALTTEIKVKMCNDYAVYYLSPLTSCDSAYCAGDAVECPGGQGSSTGYTPCSKDIPVRPKKPILAVRNTEEEVQFHCQIFGNDDTRLIYRVWWYADRDLVHEEELQYGSSYAVFGENLFHFKGKSILGKKLYCKVRARYVDKTDFSALSPSAGYFTGIEILNGDSRMNMTETEKDRYVQLRSTIPIKCNSLYWKLLPPAQQRKQCKVDVYIENTEEEKYKRPIKCPNGKVIPQIKFGSCGVELRPDNWQETHYVQIKATRDFKYDGARARFVNFDPILSLVHPIWTGYKLPTFEVLAEDFEDPKSQCRSINDPHMVTFDGHPYNNYLEGEFILYRHKRFPFEVHTFYKKCNNFATCNCAVAARAGDDVIIVDRCSLLNDITIWGKNKKVDYHYTRTQVTTNWDDKLAKGFRIYVKNGGRRYEIHFPHGAYVRIDAAGTTLLNVWMFPSPDDYEETVGLCGTFDKDKSNDLTLRDGSVYTGPGSNPKGQPHKFNQEWRVREEDSMYNGRTTNKPPYEGHMYCNCHKRKKGADWLECNFNSDVERCQLSGEDITDRRYYEYLQRKNNPKNNDGIDDDDLKFKPDKDYRPPNVSWPTPGGWTEEAARAYCVKYITESETYKKCMNYTSDLDLDLHVDNCMADILMCDCTNFTSTHLESIALACEDEMKKNMSWWDNDLHPPVICPGECNFKGRCVEGVCECEPGRAGEDCGDDLNKPPLAIFIPRDGLCDMRDRPCQHVKVYGEGFQLRDSISCLFEEVKVTGPSKVEPTGRQFKAKALFESEGQVTCDLPEPHKRMRREVHARPSGTAANAKFTVSVSNDGVKMSNPILYLAYDGRCQTCNKDGECNIKPNTCLIKGFCYAANDVNPDNECQMCNPSVSTSTWVNNGACAKGGQGLPGWAIGLMSAVAAVGMMAALVVVLKVFVLKPTKVEDMPLQKT